MKSLIAYLIILLFLSVTPIFSQKSDRDKKLEESLEKSRLEELTRAQEERDENLRLDSQRNGLTQKKMFVPNEYLLPDNPYAWVLQIITTGGFSGRGKPTITLTSNSEFACGEIAASQIQSFDVSLFQPLAEIINKADFTVKDSYFEPKSDKKFVCSDCYKTRFVLMRREGDRKIKIYESDSDNRKYKAFIENFNLIKQKADELTICPN